MKGTDTRCATKAAVPKLMAQVAPVVALDSFHALCLVLIEMRHINPLIWREADVPTSITLMMIRNKTVGRRCHPAYSSMEMAKRGWSLHWLEAAVNQIAKVFCFFFSKKKYFPNLLGVCVVAAATFRAGRLLADRRVGCGC